MSDKAEDVTLRILCVTLGGRRKHLIEKMVEELNQAKAFSGIKLQLSWCDGVDARCGFDDPATLEQIAPDVLRAIDISKEAINRWATCARRLLPKEFGVLGCFLAQLRALRAATVDGEADIIIEDSCRIRSDRAGALQLKNAVLWQRSHAPDLLYFGWLGFRDNLARVHAQCDLSDGPTLRLPRGLNNAGKPCDLIFCTYAYMGSRRLYESLCKDLRDHPEFMFRRIRGRTVCSPIDKFLLWRAGEAQLHSCICKDPCCFRAPLLTSCIHSDWDGRFVDITMYQLELTKMQWGQIWLSHDEINAPEKLGQRREQEAEEGKRNWYQKRQNKWQAWKERKEAAGEFTGAWKHEKESRETSNFICNTLYYDELSSALAVRMMPGNLCAADCVFHM